MFANINADIILYGHDHNGAIVYGDDKTYINCGSLGCTSTNEGIAKGGILTIDNDKYAFQKVFAKYDLKEVINEIDSIKYPAYKEGIDEFYKYINDKHYLSMLSVFGAFKDDNLLGVIATRNEGAHIALFFVAGRYHRQGIGRKLFQSIVNKNHVGKLTINSSPYAMPIYHKLGFIDTNQEQVVNGLRFTPMELKL